eukprot:GHVL01024962.1.p1 GENE.GHVL01024962.1~~GHVL01024962.1.p1  ORF type:complete len:158 (-),score=7.99 GHVL01024962.1:1040-1513(-)
MSCFSFYSTCPWKSIAHHFAVFYHDLPWRIEKPWYTFCDSENEQITWIFFVCICISFCTINFLFYCLTQISKWDLKRHRRVGLYFCVAEKFHHYMSVHDRERIPFQSVLACFVFLLVSCKKSCIFSCLLSHIHLCTNGCECLVLEFVVCLCAWKCVY